MVFVEGFLVGLGMIIFIGPVFFTLLRSSLAYGVMAGMMVAAGIFFSDVVCVVLCSFGAIPFFEDPNNQFWLAIGGSIVLFALGLRYILRPNVDTSSGLKLELGHYSTYFVKGFVVNFFNPFVFLVWIGVIGMARYKYGPDLELWIFLGAALLAILITDSTKVLFAHRIKKFIQPNYLLKAYRIIGVVMLAFGFRLLWFALY
jgi:threonine/homoserine/homoserine lactone efflux protein